MNLDFCKYQGTGNDFIIIDNRSLALPRSNDSMVKSLCDRRFGIGGDGLIYLQEREGYDFEMVYFNSDGRESTMCGNGGRCIVRFAHEIWPEQHEFSFLAIDGPHRANIIPGGMVSLQMQDVSSVTSYEGGYILNTGSPHFVRFIKNVREFPVEAEGRRIRYSDRFRADGINVNFAEILSDGSLFVRTYERGVENETLSCGTGVVASGLAYYCHNGIKTNAIRIETPGGHLHVAFDVREMHFTDICLTGPAARVFTGKINA